MPQIYRAPLVQVWYNICVTHRSYAEALEQRLRRINVLTAINRLPEYATLPRAMEECSRKRLLYAIVVGDENELHRSITLNILHGTPQGKDPLWAGSHSRHD